MKHRADIDGLRAIAVVSVVIYHLGMPLRGGFTGVDVFFTISGFLIGLNMLSQVQEGRFSYLDFYERRMRRLMPAFFVVLAFVGVVGWKYFLPNELETLSNSSIAAIFSVSNFYFLATSGYFDTSSESNPLLHTWSLAVEEQFYLCLPIVLALISRAKFATPRAWLTCIFLASFFASCAGMFWFPSANFYMLPTRAWELLAGVLIVMWVPPAVFASAARREVLAITGLALILGSVLLVKPEMMFPGLTALPAVLGTAMVILAGSCGPTKVGQLLSWRPVVTVGLISYSVYLWHWPLIVFSKFYGINLVDGLSRNQSQAMLFVASLVLGYVSWRFVEQPFRSSSGRFSRPSIYALTFTFMAGFAGFAAYLVQSNGAEFRFSERSRAIASHTVGSPEQYRTGQCFMASKTSSLADFDQAQCLPAPDGRPRLLVVGDSHAAALWWGFKEALPGVNVMQATASGCKPVTEQLPRQHQHCVSLIDFTYRDYLVKNKVDLVVIAARWREGDMPGLSATLKWLQSIGVQALVVGPIAQYDSPLPRLLAYAVETDDPAYARKHLLREVQPLDKKMHEKANSEWRVPYVSLYSIVCPNGDCKEYVAPDMPLYTDYGHLNKLGSEWAARRIFEKIQGDVLFGAGG